jgi:hypothetical protein
MQVPRPDRRPGSIFPAGDSSLCGSVTLAPGQQVLAPLAADLEMDGRMEEHVNTPSLVRLSRW